MPQVPYSSQPRVGPAPLPGARLNPNAPQEAFGGGIASKTLPDLSQSANIAGDVAQQDALERQRIRKEAADEANQVATTHAYSATVVKTNDMLHGPDGLLNRKGQNAFTIDQEAYDQYGQFTAEIRSQLGNDKQRAIYDKMVLNGYDQIVSQVQPHIARERQAFDKDGTKAGIDANNVKVSASYSNPAIVDDAIAANQALVGGYGKRIGLPDEEIANQKAKMESDMRFDVLKQYVDLGQDLSASAYLNKYKDKFVGDTLLKAEVLTKRGSTEGEAIRQADRIIAGAPTGQVEAGNIDVTKRPKVKNEDGSISTVRSISIEEDGKTILIPTVSPDGILSDDAAVKLYHDSGKHLGIFNTEAAAHTYAQQLHEAQAAMIAGKGNGTVRVQPPATEEAAMAQAASITEPLVREKAEQRISLYYNRKRASDVQAKQDAFEKGYQILRANGGDLSTVPLTLRTSMGAMHDQNLASEAHRIQTVRDPGDPEQFTTLLNQAYFAPEQFAQQDIPATKGLSLAQKTRLMTIQRTVGERLQRTDEADIVRGMKATEKAGVPPTDPNAAALSKDPALDAALGAHPHGSAPVTPTPSTPMTKPTPQMLEDVARKGPEYAKYLRSHNIDAPLTVPTEPAKAKKP